MATQKRTAARGPGGKGPIAVGAAVLTLCAGLIATHEGFVPKTYADPIGIPTACYGHTGPELEYGQTFTKGQCDALLNEDIIKANASVKHCILVGMQPYQEAALTSFTFNVGGAALCRSTLARKANAGDWVGACAELDKWVYAGGLKFSGLVKRRAAERAMCEGKS